MTTSRHLPFELFIKIVTMTKQLRAIIKIQTIYRGYSMRQYFSHRKNAVWKNLFRLYPNETLYMEQFGAVRFEWQHEIASWAALLEQEDRINCSRVIGIITNECENGFWGAKKIPISSH